MSATAAEAVPTELVLGELVVGGAVEGVPIGRAVKTTKACIVGGAVETMMRHMGGVGGLSVHCKTQGQYSQEEEQCLSIHDFTFL